MTDDLLAFLRARLAEDEAAARAASPGPWRPGVRSGLTAVEGDGWTVCNADDLDAAHIGRHDPARVLRRVAADRRNVDEYERYLMERRRAMNGWDSGEVSPVMAALAAVYADHPDYDEEWRP